MVFLIFALISIGVFAVPTKAKVWYTVAVIGAGALYAVMTALCSIAGYGFSAVPDCDALSSLFLIIISVASVAASIYSRGYIGHGKTEKPSAHLSLHYAALAVLSFSMMAVVSVEDGFEFLFCWELMTISSFVLIMFEASNPRTRRAAINYLVMMHVGFVLLLCGFAVIGAAGCEVSFDGMAQYFSAHRPLGLFAVFLAGFGMKAGLFPLHVWLPEAHPAAPAHVSALMSGVMIKTGVYGILRVLSHIHTDLMTIAVILLAAGTLTGLWGVILAALQRDIKRLLAYSSMENIGVIFIGIGGGLSGMAGGNSMLALCCMSGALLHIVNHSLFKTVLFFGAGNVYTQTHTVDMESLGGLCRKMPVTSWLFLFGAAAICSLPPLSGFVSEFLIYVGFLKAVSQASQTLTSLCGIVALSLIGGIVLLAFCKLYGIVFCGRPRSNAVDRATEVDTARIVSFAMPVAGILAIGLLPALFVGPVIRLSADVFSIPMSDAEIAVFQMSDTMTGVSAAAFALIILSAGLIFWKNRALSKRSVYVSPTWGCGFAAVNDRMQYSGESFSEGLQSIASNITKDTGMAGSLDEGEIFPDAHGFDVSHKDKIDNVLSRWWLLLFEEINRRVARLSSNKINHYISYALLFLALVLVLSLLNIL